MNIRYQLCPQMKIYDQLRYNWLPNVMFCQEPNYRSEILNTDNLFGNKISYIEITKKITLTPMSL